MYLTRTLTPRMPSPPHKTWSWWWDPGPQSQQACCEPSSEPAKKLQSIKCLPKGKNVILS